MALENVRSFSTHYVLASGVNECPVVLVPSLYKTRYGNDNRRRRQPDTLKGFAPETGHGAVLSEKEEMHRTNLQNGNVPAKSGHPITPIM